ncbi:hypothetical protein BKA70DRAFT_1416420 [Coprinopsis sp. MPI-PUGE-AT-0042]|nr:hypothetical protein BKA70DRAFT_1416420 [Coprinopsis sp. MPI-PUGE-AT-0042]
MAWTLPLLYTLFTFLSTACAQTSSAVCLPYYSWISNSDGKTPCEVASTLLATCSEDKTFDVLSLPLGQHYQGPTRVANANPCMCSTVVFSLMSACGICQGRTALRWSQWSSNCPRVTLSDFPNPLPEGIRVPAWAYLDVKTSDIFDQFIAQDFVNATESTAIPAPASTLTPTAEESTPIAVSTESILSSEAAEAPIQTKTPLTEEEVKAKAAADYAYANKVAGTVVGSLLGAVLIAAIVLIVLWRRRSSRVYAHEHESAHGGQRESMKEQSPLDSVPSIRVSLSASSRVCNPLSIMLDWWNAHFLIQGASLTVFDHRREP